jgi:uncharacterized protein
MQWIIDGHNLIPFVPGLSLSDLDDENALIGWLSEFVRAGSDSVELFFDKAAPQHAGSRKLGRLTVRHVPAHRTADLAISERLHGLGKQAANYTVVSSDHQVQANARECRAQVMESALFVQRMQQKKVRKASGDQKALNDDEVAMWIDLFNHRNGS